MVIKNLFVALALTTGPSAVASWDLAFSKSLYEFPAGAQFMEREARADDIAVRIQGVIFDSREYRIAVIDNEGAAESLASAALAAGAIAGVNGGYFHPDFRPVGLEIAGGKQWNGFERAKLLSGAFVATKGRPKLLRAAEFKASSGNTDALQAGPFLVDGGAATAGLESTRPARRTVLATDGKDKWAILLMSRVTLAGAAEILSSKEIFSDFQVDRALNLDGGSSSALWVDTPEKPFYLRELTPVRNFLAIIPKNP